MCTACVARDKRESYGSPNQRAARGAAKLDGSEPDWRTLVQPDLIALDHDEDCILGQVYGYYETGCTVLNIDQYQAEEYGFLPYDSEDAERLNAAWRELL